MGNRVLFWLYQLALCLGLPVVFVYFLWHSRKEPAYAHHWRERWGGYSSPFSTWAKERVIWVHAASLGEVRAALPLIRKILETHKVLITVNTPAGRQTVQDNFAQDIENGRVIYGYCPIDLWPFWGRFLRQFTPVATIVIEAEFWPAMARTLHKRGIPMILSNGVYQAKKPREKVKTRRFAKLALQHFTHILAKSPEMAQRFRDMGCENVDMVGELRFDAPLPTDHITDGRTLKTTLKRPVITLASIRPEELDHIIPAIKKAQENDAAPLFVLVPRSDFDRAYQKLIAADLRVLRHSQTQITANTDVILGDTYNNMFFYLALADFVFVGGGFSPKGSHNVIEPMLLQIPTAVGPNIHTYRDPISQGMKHGLIHHLNTPQELISCLSHLPPRPDPTAWAQLLESQTGAVDKTMKILRELIDQRP